MSVLLILCSLTAGLAEASRLRMRSRELGVFSDALAAMKNAAAYTAGDLSTLLRLCSENAFVQAVEQAAEREENPLAAWKSAADTYFTNADDAQLVKEFINGYGHTDLSGLLAHISLFEEKTAVRLKHAENAVETKSRLYTVLGLFTGTAVALLLI